MTTPEELRKMADALEAYQRLNSAVKKMEDVLERRASSKEKRPPRAKINISLVIEEWDVAASLTAGAYVPCNIYNFDVSYGSFSAREPVLGELDRRAFACEALGIDVRGMK